MLDYQLVSRLYNSVCLLYGQYCVLSPTAAGSLHFCYLFLCCQVSDMFWQLAKIMLSHVKCLGAWRHETSFSARVSALTACSNVLKRKTAHSGMRMKKEMGSCGGNAEQRKGHGAWLQVRNKTFVCVWQHDTVAQTTEMSRVLLSGSTVRTFSHSSNTSLRYVGLSTTALTWAWLGFNDQDHYTQMGLS